MEYVMTRCQRIRMLLVLLTPATIVNTILALLRLARLYRTFVGELILSATGIDIALQPRILVFDPYFLLLQTLIVVFTMALFEYKESRRLRGIGFPQRPLVMVGLAGFALLVFGFLFHAPNARTITDFLGLTQNSSILSRYLAAWFIPSGPIGYLGTKICLGLSIAVLNGAFLGAVAAPIYRYGELRDVVVSSKPSLAKALSITRILLHPSAAIRFIAVGAIVSATYCILVFPTIGEARPSLTEIFVTTTLAYTQSRVNSYNVLAITFLVWSLSTAYFLSLSDLSTPVVVRYIWATRKADLATSLVLMLAFLMISVVAAPVWLPFAAACTTASVTFHRIMINGFGQFDSLSEDYIGCTIRKLVAGSTGNILIVGAGAVGKAILRDTISYETITERTDPSFEIWPGGPTIQKITRGRKRIADVVHGVIVIDESQAVVRKIGEYAPVGTYGYVGALAGTGERGRAEEVVVPAVVAKVGQGRTPTLGRASTIVVSVENPVVPDSLLFESTRGYRAVSGSQGPIVIARMSSASELFQIVQSGKQAGINVVPLYFERELGYHLGLALALSARVPESKAENDYLFISDGSKRLYHALEALFLHGRLRESARMVDGKPLLRALVLTSSRAFAELCKPLAIEGITEQLAYTVTWTTDEQEKQYLVPVRYQQKDYALLHELVHKKSLKGILISESTEQDNLSAIAIVSRVLAATNPDEPAPIVVVSANGDLDSSGVETFLAHAKIPYYSVIWSDFVAAQVSSILRVLRAGASRLAIKDIECGKLRQVIRQPSSKTRHRVYCPVAALMGWNPTSDKQEEGLDIKSLTNRAIAAHFCTPDEVGVLSQICGILMKKKTIITPRKIPPPASRDYSLVTFCFDEYPGSLLRVIEQLTGSSVTEEAWEGNLNISHISTFDCGLDGRVCVRLFAHSTHRDHEEAGIRSEPQRPLRIFAALVPASKGNYWQQNIRNALRPSGKNPDQRDQRTYLMVSKSISSDLVLLVAYSSDSELTKGCLCQCTNRSCLIRNFREQVKTITGTPIEDRTSHKPDQGHQAVANVSLHFLQSHICEPKYPQTLSRCTAYAFLAD